MRREPFALQTDFDTPEIVSEVYADPIPTIDGGGEFDDHDVVYLIEQEFCFLSPDSTHTYLNGHRHCCHCGMAHPSIRNSGCGSR